MVEGQQALATSAPRGDRPPPPPPPAPQHPPAPAGVPRGGRASPARGRPGGGKGSKGKAAGAKQNGSAAAPPPPAGKAAKKAAAARGARLSADLDLRMAVVGSPALPAALQALLCPRRSSSGRAIERPAQSDSCRPA